MPEQLKKMNGVIHVPITTLAGIASLSDLLPEMPLPTPLPQTLTNKSLLFHPRVAEEAQLLLSVRDENLVPQLITSLSQTSSDHIQLKEHQGPVERPLDADQQAPELLKTILQMSPNVFKNPDYSTQRTWSQSSAQQQQQQMTTGQSPVAYSTHFSPQGSPAHQQRMMPASSTGMIQHAQHPRMPPHGNPDVSHMSPFPVPSPRSNIMTDQTRTPMSAHMHEEANCNSMPGMNNPHVNIYSPAHMTASPVGHYGNLTPQHHMQQQPPPQQQQQHHHTPQHQQQQQFQQQQQQHVYNAMLDPTQMQMPMVGGNQQPMDQIDTMAHQQFLLDSGPLPEIDLGMDNIVKHHMQPTTGNHGMVDHMQQNMIVNQQPDFMNLNNVIPTLNDDAATMQQQQQQQPQHHHQPVPQSNNNNNHHHHLQQQQQAAQQQQPVLANADNRVARPVVEDMLDKMKKPVVMLNRLSLADQALMQKSLSAFAEKSPRRAAKMGIKKKDDSSSDEESGGNNSGEDSEWSDSGTPGKKHFKTRRRGGGTPQAGEKSRRRKRVNDDDDDSTRASRDETFSPTKPKIKRIEKKLVPVLAKLSPEELMDTNIYQRFNNLIGTIFENTEDYMNAEFDDDGDVPNELLISRRDLQDLCAEAAKLKSVGAMGSVPSDKLVQILHILEKNIRDGARVSPLTDPDDDMEENKSFVKLAMDRVQRAIDASLVCLYIMTSRNIAQNVYLEDVIDRIILFMKFQMQNTIYPSYDPVYRIDTKSKTDNYNAGRRKRGHVKEVREKPVLLIYNKMTELVGLLAELLNMQTITDTSVLHASTLGVGPFFVESIESIQLSALKLVTVIFTKYEKHRRLVLDDILASIARLPSSKRGLRTYSISPDEYIQMLTALVLQLIQCVVVLPDSIAQQQDQRRSGAMSQEGKDSNEKRSQVSADLLIINKYELAKRTAFNFLNVFLNKCSQKGDEVDYRPLFENFIQDLLSTVNKPEWPASELLLSLLGQILVGHFSNKGSDMALRVASIEYLGVVAARLRRDAVTSTSQQKLGQIDQIIRDIKAEQQKEGDYDQNNEICGLSKDEERTAFLQKVLLDYLAVKGASDASMVYARHFYLAQWYKECELEKTHVKQGKHSPKKAHNKKKHKKKGRHRGGETSDESESDIEELDQDENDNEQKNSEAYRIIEEKKKFILSRIRLCNSAKPDVLQTYIDANSAELISQYLASKRAFSQSFDLYLKRIIQVLMESSIAIRTKAMKCLTIIVEADPSVLGRPDMQVGVRHSFLDHSTAVREAAIDLVGRFVLKCPELIESYYVMLSARILDTGVSVRKRVIKILKEICMGCPEFDKIPEICVKMIRRVNDEEGIRKLVMEVFQNMWFTPMKDSTDHLLRRKVLNITDVVAACKDIGLEWFEQLLVSLFKPKEDKEDSTKVLTEPPKSLITACRQIVDCLIEHVLRIDENNMDNASQNSQNPQRLVACLTTLYLFAKIRPQLLVNHAITLQPYLALKCQSPGDFQVISNVAHTLELVVPLMEHPSETFLAQLEEDSVKLILTQDKSVVNSCLSCLGSIVNNVTKNFKLIRDCFNKYFGTMTQYKTRFELNRNDPSLFKYKPFFKRAVFTVGLLLRYFDFDDAQVNEGLPDNTKDRVFETLFYFFREGDPDIKHITLQAIGFVCIRHYQFMMLPELKELYQNNLHLDMGPINLKTQVLNNIEVYLQEEERRMIQLDAQWKHMHKKENLKEMGDVSSGMASTVIQLYLKQILESYLHVNVSVRSSALKVIQLILSQGLVHPVTIVPYLICMSTDEEKPISHSADKQLQEIEKKYPGFINMKSQSGVKLSYKLQKTLQASKGAIVRGMRPKDNELPSALNGYLYSLLRGSKPQRRAIASSFLKQFDESAKLSLSEMLYLADNLAYFSYQVQDEPLFIIHSIDIIISVSGENLRQSFREALLPKPSDGSQTTHHAPQQQVIYGPDGQQVTLPTHTIEDEEDDEEDEEAIMARLPEDTTLLREYLTASQGFMLLLTLRQHLKDLYGMSDAKISQYSPETAKVYEKAVNRKNVPAFMPKGTLQKLKEGDLREELDEVGRKNLVKEFLDFRQLMLKFDPEDPEDDVDEHDRSRQQNAQQQNHPPLPSLRISTVDGGRVSTINPLLDGVQQQQQSAAAATAAANYGEQHPNNTQPRAPSAPRVPKLTIHTTPESREHHRKHRNKTEQKKKHKKKKKRRLSDSSESDDCSDPDYMA